MSALPPVLGEEAGFTPGPWRVGADLVGICVDWRDPGGSLAPEAKSRNGWAKTVAKVSHGSWAGVAEHVANARLIAASPDLYAALEKICDSGVSLGGHHRALAIAALRKVRGQ